MTKLTNITAPQHRCSVGGCPAVLKSDDGKTLTIIGKSGDPRNLPDGVAVGDFEEVIEIPAEVVQAALGIGGPWTPEMRRAAMKDAQNICDLVKAAEPIMQALEKREQKYPERPLPDYFDLTITLGQARALRSIIDRIKGGANE